MQRACYFGATRLIPIAHRKIAAAALEALGRLPRTGQLPAKVGDVGVVVSSRNL